MGVERTSRTSNDTSSFCGPRAFLATLLSCSVLILRNRLREFRISQWQQWPLLEVHGKKTHPQSDQGHRNNDVQPCRQCPGREFGPRHPEKVDQPHENHPQSDLGNETCVPLHILGKQQEEWDGEMENQDDHGNQSPAAAEPGAIKSDFFRLVSGPDDQQLRKIKIGPKHVESEEQLPEI